jgi:hypothetical protein
MLERENAYLKEDAAQGNSDACGRTPDLPGHRKEKPSATLNLATRRR